MKADISDHSSIHYPLTQICINSLLLGASLVAQMVKNPSTMQEIQVWSLGEEHPQRRDWLPNPVFLPGEFHGQRSLASYSPWGLKELDMTEWLTLFLLLLVCSKICFKTVIPTWTLFWVKCGFTLYHQQSFLLSLCLLQLWRIIREFLVFKIYLSKCIVLKCLDANSSLASY